MYFIYTVKTLIVKFCVHASTVALMTTRMRFCKTSVDSAPQSARLDNKNGYEGFPEPIQAFIDMMADTPNK